MRDPYQVLGVSPGAPDEDIKRAFRRLAKELHPDLHPGDASAEARFREVMSAYQALTAVPTMTVPAPRRQGLRAQAATMAGVFLLTVGTVGAALLLISPEPRETPPPVREAPRLPAARVAPPPGTPPRLAPPSETALAASPGTATAAPQGTGSAGAPDAAALPPRSPDVAVDARAPGRPRAHEPAAISDAGAAPLPDSNEQPAGALGRGDAGASSGDVTPRPPSSSRPAAFAWAKVRNVRFGFSLSYPADVFASGPAHTDERAAFLSRDGRASLVVSAGTTRGTTLAAHRRALMAGPYKGAEFDYTPRRAYWFVLSGVLGGDIFYQRVTFSCDRLTVHSWKLVYPLAERGLYDRIVEEMHRRYRHSNGAGARCGEARVDWTGGPAMRMN
jgi:hypothetical protein